MISQTYRIMQEVKRLNKSGKKATPKAIFRVLSDIPYDHISSLMSAAKKQGHVYVNRSEKSAGKGTYTHFTLTVAGLNWLRQKKAKEDKMNCKRIRQDKRTEANNVAIQAAQTLIDFSPVPERPSKGFWGYLRGLGSALLNRVA